MAATFQNVSGGRLALDTVSGGELTEMKRCGDWLDHDQRYARTDEFLTVLRGAWDCEGITNAGEHYNLADARVLSAPDPVAPIYFGCACK